MIDRLKTTAVLATAIVFLVAPATAQPRVDRDAAALAMYSARLPHSEATALSRVTRNLNPNQSRLVLKALWGLEQQGQKVARRGTLDVAKARKLMTASLAAQERPAFSSVWGRLGGQQRETLLTLARDAYAGGLTDDEEEATMGGDALAMANPASGRAMRFAEVAPGPITAGSFLMGIPAESRQELDGFLARLSPEDADVVARGLAGVEDRGRRERTGPTSRFLQHTEARDMLVEALEERDRNRFENLWKRMSWRLKHPLTALTQDAYFGGIAD
jgi:hypothetical protein